MSKTVLITPQQILDQNSLDINADTSVGDFNKIATDLESKNPDLAAKFRSIDFGEIKNYLIKQALQKVASENDCSYQEGLDFSDKGWNLIKDNVDIAGWLVRGENVMAFYTTEKGRISVYSPTLGSFANDMTSFEKMYREDAMGAALKIIAPAIGIKGEVKKTTNGGTTTLTIG